MPDDSPLPDPLTPSDRIVLDGLRAGRLDAETAVELGISVGDVRLRIERLSRRFGVASRAGLAGLREDAVPFPAEPPLSGPPGFQAAMGQRPLRLEAAAPPLPVPAAVALEAAGPGSPRPGLLVALVPVSVLLALIVFVAATSGGRQRAPAASAELPAFVDPTATATLPPLPKPSALLGQAERDLFREPDGFPGDAALYIVSRCRLCDHPITGLDRMTADTGGTIRLETLFQVQPGPAGYISSIWVAPDATEVFAAFCPVADCNRTPGARNTIRRSTDLGTTWTDIATVEGDVTIIGLTNGYDAGELNGANSASARLLVERDSPASGARTFLLLPAGVEVQPPSLHPDARPVIACGVLAWLPRDGFALKTGNLSYLISWPLLKARPLAAVLPPACNNQQQRFAYNWYENAPLPAPNSVITMLGVDGAVPHMYSFVGVIWPAAWIDSSRLVANVDFPSAYVTGVRPGGAATRPAVVDVDAGTVYRLPNPPGRPNYFSEWNQVVAAVLTDGR
ncbi:MAG: hypothetical protein HYX53_14310 [Chloroflexi bacterium]|nr:hypothetical protein [Chloroflexota bacterium]